MGDEDRPRVVGKPEIARMLGVARGTPAQWQRRPATELPEADHAEVNGHEAWRTETIEEWAKRTGRWPSEGEVEEC